MRIDIVATKDGSCTTYSQRYTVLGSLTSLYSKTSELDAQYT